MSKFIIIGDCNGVNYYFKRGDFDGNESINWQGLLNNATKFNSEESAKQTENKIRRVSKLCLRVAKLHSRRSKNYPPPATIR